MLKRFLLFFDAFIELKHVPDLTIEVPAELLQDIQVNSLGGLVVEQRDGVAMDIEFTGKFGNPHLPFAHKCR